MLIGPDITLLRSSRKVSRTVASLSRGLRERCTGRDWSGPRGVLIGTVDADSFEVRRALAFRTPVRCVVRGEISSIGDGALVTLRFGMPTFPVVFFWASLLLLPPEFPFRLAAFVVLVVATFALFAHEARATGRLIDAWLSEAPRAPAAPSTDCFR